MEGVTVVIFRRGAAPRVQTTSRDGKTTFELGEGEFELTAELGDRRPVKIVFTTRAGESLLIPVRLGPTGEAWCDYEISTDYFRPKSVCSASKEEWYLQHLNAMGEDSIYRKPLEAAEESYRFLWLRSFHHPVSVRVDFESPLVATASLKILDGRGGYLPGKLTTEESRRLSSDEIRSFRAALDAAGLWDLAANSSRRGTDGAHWVLEGATVDRYAYADRWSPPSDEPVKGFGLFMLSLTSIDEPAHEIY